MQHLVLCIATALHLFALDLHDANVSLAFAFIKARLPILKLVNDMLKAAIIAALEVANAAALEKRQKDVAFVTLDLQHKAKRRSRPICFCLLPARLTSRY